MLILWHGASEVIGGLLCIITLAPNVVNRLTCYTTYTLYQVHDFMGMTGQVSPRKAREWPGPVRPHLKQSKAPPIETVDQR